MEPDREVVIPDDAWSSDDDYRGAEDATPTVSPTDPVPPDEEDPLVELASDREE